MRISPAILWVVFLSGLVGSGQTLADIAVIASNESPLSALTPHEVADLYLGLTRSVGAHAEFSVVVYEHPDNSLRANFYRILNGMSINQLNAYWARLQFSGAVLPPVRLPDSQAVLDAVSHHSNAIGYIETNRLNDSVKVLRLFQEGQGNDPSVRPVASQ